MEKITKGASGMLWVLNVFILIGLTVLAFYQGEPLYYGIGAALCVILFTLLFGFTINEPNESHVLIYFGEYKGTLKESGFYWVNPFMVKKKVSLRANNLNGTPLKVNDKMGNPIEIAAVIVWQVLDTAKASFNVEDYKAYVTIQSEAAIRHLANIYPYDNLEDHHGEELTLRGGADTVNHLLEAELDERLAAAGIKVIEARISHLAYAPEIAGAMLQRQQAQAVVAARKQIVEGAVGMVKMALENLQEEGIMDLDPERKASMVTNLMVVLCAEKPASPVINAGTMYH